MLLLAVGIDVSSESGDSDFSEVRAVFYRNSEWISVLKLC